MLCPELFSVLFGEAGISRYTDNLISYAVIAAVLVLPFLLGRSLANSLRMPTYGTRIGLIIFTIVLSLYFLRPIKNEIGKWQVPLKYGVDLSGGTILVYELKQDAVAEGNATSEQDPTTGQMVTRANKSAAKELIQPLIERLNPSGTNDIVVRPYGEQQIEIIVPNTEQSEVEQIQRSIETAGALRFAIVANTRDHRGLISQAQLMSESPTDRRRTEIRNPEGQVIGLWAEVDRESNGDRYLRVDVYGDIIRDAITKEIIENAPRLGREEFTLWMKEKNIEAIEVLMAIDPLFDITGEELSVVSRGVDERGGHAVDFQLKDLSADRFYALTQRNSPTGDFQRRLGIVLDDRLMSAPNLRSTISSRGQISGSFTKEEVDFLVTILQSGSLPAALVKTPVAKNQIGSTMGADTIRNSSYAMVIAVGIVILFMVGYYRMSGVIACIAMALNILFTLAIMVVFRAPLTLPGMAGLVLTIGMSVDANVLIFERMREERDRGAATRMAIRNGFSRAMTTIIDSNLTSIITAVVLYAIGTDNIRGFAVTLILGILSSMFTAIYVARTIFDIGERHGWISLSMSNLAVRFRDMLGGKSGFDFMKIKVPAILFSLVFIGLGIAALFARGNTIWDVDFSGGTNVVFQLREPRQAEEVRDIVESALNPEGTDQKVNVVLTDYTVENSAPNTVFKLDSSLEDIDRLTSTLVKSLVDDKGESLLVHYEASIKPSDAASADEAAPPAPDAPEAETKSGTEKATGAIVPQRLDVQTVAFRPLQDQEKQADAGSDEPKKSDEKSASEPAKDAEAKAPAADTKSSDTKPSDSSAEAKPADTAPPAAEKKDDTTADAAKTEAAKPREVITSTARVNLSIRGSERTASVTGAALINDLLVSAKTKDIPLDNTNIHLQPFGEGAESWNDRSSLRFTEWNVTLDLPSEQADKVFEGLKEKLATTPALLGSSKIGGRVAEGMRGQAIAATVVSMIFLIIYIWFRFHRFVYGLAAVIALVHDVLITVGALAGSVWLARYLGFNLLMVEDFKISLSVIAAILTLIGYSLNDTIVTFDRIREIKGKSPTLTADMINRGVNETLSRTVLTFLTTFIVVVVLYFFGGEEIHAFAFSLVVGMIAGTYSSIFIAAPILIWMGDSDERRPTAVVKKA